jgi:hypothetical protein
VNDTSTAEGDRPADGACLPRQLLGACMFAVAPGLGAGRWNVAARPARCSGSSPTRPTT